MGLHFTKDEPDHQQSVALSGEAGTQGGDVSSTVGKGARGEYGVQVNATYTIDARAWADAVVTPLPEPTHALVYYNANVNVEEREGGGSLCPKATRAHHREVLEMEEEGRAKREQVRQSASQKRRFQLNGRISIRGMMHNATC